MEQNWQAVSLIFHDANRDIRLIGNFQPLHGGNNNIPSDPFDQEPLALALQGKPNTTVLQRLQREQPPQRFLKSLRRPFALSIVA